MADERVARLRELVTKALCRGEKLHECALCRQVALDLESLEAELERRTHACADPCLDCPACEAAIAYEALSREATPPTGTKTPEAPSAPDAWKRARPRPSARPPRA